MLFDLFGLVGDEDHRGVETERARDHVQSRLSHRVHSTVVGQNDREPAHDVSRVSPPRRVVRRGHDQPFFKCFGFKCFGFKCFGKRCFDSKRCFGFSKKRFKRKCKYRCK